MGKKLHKFMIIFVVLFFFGILFAQIHEPSGAGQKMDTEVLKVYFFLLVFATIISRIIQYIKLFFQWLWPKVGFFQTLSEKLWVVVKRQLDKLGLSYDEDNVKGTTNTILLAIVLHTVGFIIGMVICVNFQLGVINLLGWVNIPSTLNYLLTGILIGAGIDPVHTVFRLTEEKRRVKKLKAAGIGIRENM